MRGYNRHMDMRMRSSLLLAFALVAVSCGEPSQPSDPSAGKSASPTTVSEPTPLPPDQLYEVTRLVLDEGKGPRLCLSGVNDSLPPHCEGPGPKVRGWDWASVEHEREGEVRWGEFTLRGTYRKGVFTLKGEPATPVPYDPDLYDDEYDAIGVPCDEPGGGWPRPDPDMTSREDLLAAIRAAEDEPDSAGAWIDYLTEPTNVQEMQGAGENIVLVLAFTGDAERHESEARQHWGGGLCIWIHERTQRELGEIQSAMGDPWVKELGIETTWSDTDIVNGIVSIGVIVSTPEFEAELARRYGAGVVRVLPALRPVEEDA